MILYIILYCLVGGLNFDSGQPNPACASSCQCLSVCGYLATDITCQECVCSVLCQSIMTRPSQCMTESLYCECLASQALVTLICRFLS